MKVFVIGSMYKLEDQHEKDAFSEAARALGEQLATRKHSIILCSAAPSTADPYIIEGSNRIKPSPKAFIYRPDRQTIEEDPDLDASVFESRYPDMRLIWRDCNGGWRVVHLRAMREADAILALGGSPRGTGTVIYSAEVLEKPIALLPTFKGVSEFAWRDFSRHYPQEIQDKLNRPWTADSEWASEIVSALESLKRTNPFKRKNNLRDSLKLLVGIAFLLAWLIPLVSPGVLPLPGWAAVFIAIAFASMAGSIIRNTLRSMHFLQTEWPIDNVIVEVLLGLFLAVLIIGLTELAGFLLFGQTATFPNEDDVRRAGWLLSVSAFVSAALVERAWERVSEIGKKLLPD